jgi:hypothetical protein
MVYSPTSHYECGWVMGITAPLRPHFYTGPCLAADVTQ